MHYIFDVTIMGIEYNFFLYVDLLFTNIDQTASVLQYVCHISEKKNLFILNYPHIVMCQVLE